MLLMSRYFREHRKKLCLALALGGLLCCITLAQDIKTSYAPDVNFSKYHTYKWVAIKGQQSYPGLDAEIKQSFDSELAARGLTKADGTADLNVDYQTALSKVATWQVYEDWSDAGPAMRLPQRKKVMIDVGALVIDMYDTAGKALVWTGRANKAVDLKSSPEERQKTLDTVAKKMLVDFPPK